MQKAAIFAELNQLLQQQTEMIQGKIGPAEAADYARRSARIRELFALLNEPSESSAD
jgi:hypothetical protein